MGAGADLAAVHTSNATFTGTSQLDQQRDLTRARAVEAGAIMLQSTGLSLLIIVGLVPVAALGVLGLAIVMQIHEMAGVFVIANPVHVGRLAGFAAVLQPPAPSRNASLSPSPAPPWLTAAAAPRGVVSDSREDECRRAGGRTAPPQGDPRRPT